MQHLVGWFEDVDQGNAAADIAAMPDETLFTSGDIVRVPAPIANLAGAAIVSAATTLTRAQLQSPSLRTLANYDIEPLNNAATPANPPAIAMQPANPLPLMGDESLTMETLTDHAAAIEIYGFAWLVDGPLQPVQGQIFSVRFTTGITLADGVWTNGNITFQQDLPFGDYQVVGLSVRSANLVAARLVFPGGRWRPGVLGRNAIGDVDNPHFRHGMSGVLGEFNSNTPPSLDAVGVTDTAQVGILDLIKVG
jgi:hypothetical protein